MKPLYLDAAASTPVSPTILVAMKPYLLEQYGNPSSPHAMGESAMKALTHARTTLAQDIHARAHEMIITSGATESNNLALEGLAKAYPHKKKVIISGIEHASVRAPAYALKAKGYTLVELAVDREGFIDMRQLEKELTPTTLVVSIIHGQNVIGTLQDLESIGKLCRKRGVLFHTDAAQSFGKTTIDVTRMNIDLLSASAHKIGGPKGTGLLYVREGISIKPIIHGGGQERGLRSGTENVASAIGFAKASEELKKKNLKKLEKSRDILMNELEKLGGTINGSRLARLINNIHVSFQNANAEMLVARLSHKGVYVSTGSACETHGDKEDYVLKALGLGAREIKGSIRISLWSPLSSTEIKRVIAEIKKVLTK